MMEREAFQEIDYRQMFGPMAKWVAQIDSADRIPELVSRAFHVATSGRPGPVVLALPEDMLVDESSVADAAPYAITRVHAAAGDDLEAARALLAGAERPLVIVGGAPWSAEANEALTRWCVDGAVSVASGWRCQDYVDNTARRLRRSSRARPRSAPRATGPRRRRVARDRRPPQRDHDLGVHAPRCPEPGAGTRSRHR